TELQSLYEDLTINVTQFFRDPEIFEYIKSELLNKLVVGHNNENPIRIWVPGCSTGEEVYSLAMILLEILEENNSKIPFQIFATDISETVLKKGRIGIYSNEIKSDVSPERLQKFFTKINNDYQINKNIRDCCLFARHDVTHDSPFSRIDLISCRNLLIYLNPKLQKKVIDIFSYALNLNGLLVLGNSENISNTQGVLKCINKNCKIHIKISKSLKLPVQTAPYRSKFIKQNANPASTSTPTQAKPYDFKAEMDRVYTERFGHSGLLINDRMDILQLYGNVSPFLEFTPGEATFNIAKMISKNLLNELRAILLTVKKSKKPSVIRGVQLKEKNKIKTFNIDVIPIIGPDLITYYSAFFTDVSIAAQAIGPTTLVSLVDKKLKASKKGSKYSIDEISAKKQASALSDELDETKKLIQTIIEEHDVTDEELQTVNEELMSSNEELQSSNEELQTAQEELQSTNEELRTLNEELNFRNSELDSLSGDLSNILNSVATPIIIIGGDYIIRRFTPAAQELFNVIPGDLGRSFTNIKHNLKVENLETLISESINKNSSIEKDVQDIKDHWYSLKIRPYTTPDNRIDGVVCVVIDINDAKTISEKFELERNIAEAVVESVENPLLILDENLNVKSANESFYKTFKIKSKNIIDHKVYDIDNRQWDIPALREFLGKMASSSQKFTNFNITHTFSNIGEKVLQLRGGQVVRKDELGNDIFLKIYLLSIEDVTEQVRDLNTEIKARIVAETDQTRSESALKSAEAISKDLVEEKEIRLKFISTLSHDLLTPLTVARLNSEILTKKVKDNEVVQKSGKAISRNIDRVVEMLTGLLSVNRIEAGQKILLKIEKCNLSSIISISLDSLIAIHGDRFIYNNPMPIEGFWDASALQRVLENLCSNAIKYGNDQPITINLFSQERYIQLTVHNEGRAIPIEDQATLFDLFHRSDEAVHSEKVGWGIGLTYVDEVIHAHKGTIQIQSAEGFGTSFIITLPKDTLNY
ncbi:MAG: PAS domain-containing protein, partial [Bacteriovorax sp.]|nr:PAS domain-containing protein [Bacteriovorax sp.]